jgi:fructokinase
MLRRRLLADGVDWRLVQDGHKPSTVANLHLGSISMVREPGASALGAVMRREHGRRVLTLDPNVRPSLLGERARYVARLEGWVSLADVVKVSRADLAWLYPEMTPDAAAARARRSRSRTTSAPATPSPPVLLAWLVQAAWFDRAKIRQIPAHALREGLAFAVRAASITCTRAGAQPPTRAEMDTVVLR